MMKTFILVTLAWIVRLVAKLYEWTLRCANFFLLSRDQLRDPTQILLDCYTPAQRAAESLAGNSSALEPKHRSQQTDEIRLLIVIPFRDRWAMTERCLASVLAQRFSFPLRVILADNKSVESATSSGVQSFLAQHPNIFQLITLNYEFNFSRINNDAVASAGEFGATHILFLNNDVILVDEYSLEQLVAMHRALPRVGALGCTLLYEDRTIQHLFVAPGVKLVAAHPLKRLVWDKKWEWFAKPRPVAAVTGALMLVSAKDFDGVSRFDVDLAHASQDVDLCLKFQKSGLINWTAAPLTALHLEGASRGHGHHSEEAALMYQRWGSELTDNSFYSGRLSRWSESPLLRPAIEPAYPWRLLLLAVPRKYS
jgi:GT2 family glycosyltransferase